MIILFLFSGALFAQQGGKSVYNFLNLTNAARVAALGGNVVSLNDNDLNLPFHNPALLNAQMHNHLVLNYVNYFSDINYGYVSYARNVKNLGNFAAGLHYINYGAFDRTDEYGHIQGKFYASEYAFNLLYSREIDSSFSWGINLKPVYSILDSYESIGILADAGILYQSADRLFSAAFVVKNVGTQIKPYHENHKEPVPFEIQAGITKKLAHAPFRLSVAANNLQQYDLTYEDPQQEQDELFVSTGTRNNNKLKEHADKIMRHIVLGVEIIPTQNFFLNIGYNYRRRQELKIDTRSYTVGFSWGFGLKISKFRISYGRATYHLAGASNHFSLSTNFNEFYRKN